MLAYLGVGGDVVGCSAEDVGSRIRCEMVERRGTMGVGWKRREAYVVPEPAVTRLKASSRSLSRFSSSGGSLLSSSS